MIIFLTTVAIVACVSACGSDNTTAMSDAQASIDASTTRVDGSVDSNCTFPSSLSPVLSDQDASGNGLAEDPLDVEVSASLGTNQMLYFTSADAESVPLGEHEMSGQWLDANCTYCLFINSNNLATQEPELWFPISGTISITSVANNFILSGTNLEFAHVDFVGDTLAVELAEDGCHTVFTTFEINTPMRIGGGP